MTPSIVKFFHKNIIKAVHHVRETILCPQSDHLSFFFSVSASLFLCYSFFLSSHHGTKSQTELVFIVLYDVVVCHHNKNILLGLFFLGEA